MIAMCLADRLANNTYDEQISGVHIEVRVFENLLRKRMPKLHRHMERVDVALLAIIPQWFLSLFTQACPIEVCTRACASMQSWTL
jgi:CDP-diacylglycerol pyrophosphatase